MEKVRDRSDGGRLGVLPKSVASLTVALSLLGGCSDLRASTPEDTAGTELETHSQPEVVVEHREMRAFNDFRLPQAVEDEVINQIPHRTHSVAIGSSACTGSIVNGYLVTAAHCGEERGEAAVDVKSWQDGYSRVHATVSAWSTAEGVDLLIGKIGWHDGYLEETYVPYFADAEPAAGKRFIASTLPGGNERQSPLTTGLTYLGQHHSTPEAQPVWIFAVDPETELPLATDLCRPGASGSLITDGEGGLGVLISSVILPGETATSEEWTEWENYRDDMQDRFFVDLSGVNALCIATPLTRPVFNNYIAPLE